RRDAQEARSRWCRWLSNTPGQQIHDPAAPGVDRSLLAAVAEDVGVLAPGVFEGVGQNREAVEGPVGVDTSCDLDHDALVPRHPRRVDSHWAEWVAEQVTQEPDLSSLLHAYSLTESLLEDGVILFITRKSVIPFRQHECFAGD